MSENKRKAYFHLPGLFEFEELYSLFLPLFDEHREWFYDWVEIGSLYGAPQGCLWNGGREETQKDNVKEAAELCARYGISARMTFSNLFLEQNHLSDPRCNTLCTLFEHNGTAQNGVILASDLLLAYLKEKYPDFCLVSSTTKVILDPEKLKEELERKEFSYVVPDFRFNPDLKYWNTLPKELRDKVEFLANEACWFGCRERKACYESVSRQILGTEGKPHVCHAPHSAQGYVFSRAMKNPGFLSMEKIRDLYLPMGYTNFKIEGRGLGSALVLEFLLYYLTKREYQLNVREKIYLSNTLDLF